MKIAIVLGTRPEIIKMAPVIKECKRQKIDFFILHTGQHYTKELDEEIFQDLDLPMPKYNLHVGSNSYRMQVGMMVNEIEKILTKEKPTMVLVQGDTISVLAGALAAKKLNISVGHHEAGLRSHDITMLEEINRVIVDHISDYLFVPTPDALKNVYQEGRSPDKIYFTGNTIGDVILQNLEIAKKKTGIMEKLKLREKSYFLVTAHRAENVDNEQKLLNILKVLDLINLKYSKPIIFPVHPRTKKRMEEFNLVMPASVTTLDPPGFLEFLQLENNAILVLTDSGGVQEECSILKIPCVTLRENTERPETVEYGLNILAGTNPEKILESVQTMLEKEINLSVKNPFGDGKAAERIVGRIIESVGNDNPNNIF